MEFLEFFAHFQFYNFLWLKKNLYTGKRIRSRNKGYKLGRHMGYISTVNDAKELLEKLYKMTHEPPQR